jgi:hypothetical protein
VLNQLANRPLIFKKLLLIDQESDHAELHLRLNLLYLELEQFMKSAEPGLLFEEAAATYAALSPTKIATYVTVKDFQHFWQTVRERTGSSYSGLHFGHYMAASFCLDLSLLHAAKLTICAKIGVSLA